MLARALNIKSGLGFPKHGDIGWGGYFLYMYLSMWLFMAKLLGALKFFGAAFAEVVMPHVQA